MPGAHSTQLQGWGLQIWEHPRAVAGGRQHRPASPSPHHVALTWSSIIFFTATAFVAPGMSRSRILYQLPTTGPCESCVLSAVPGPWGAHRTGQPPAHTTAWHVCPPHQHSPQSRSRWLSFSGCVGCGARAARAAPPAAVRSHRRLPSVPLKPAWSSGGQRSWGVGSAQAQPPASRVADPQLCRSSLGARTAPGSSWPLAQLRAVFPYQCAGFSCVPTPSVGRSSAGLWQPPPRSALPTSSTQLPWLGTLCPSPCGFHAHSQHSGSQAVLQPSCFCSLLENLEHPPYQPLTEQTPA